MARLFTLDEATRLLPYLTTLLHDLQQKQVLLEEKEEDLRLLQYRMAGNGHGHGPEFSSRQAAVATAKSERNEAIAAILALGCELKGIEGGLIDFPTHYKGREVYLCWQLGEPRIAYWHDYDTGFPGRQPLE